MKKYYCVCTKCGNVHVVMHNEERDISSIQVECCYDTSSILVYDSPLKADLIGVIARYINDEEALVDYLRENGQTIDLLRINIPHLPSTVHIEPYSDEIMYKSICPKCTSYMNCELCHKGDGSGTGRFGTPRQCKDIQCEFKCNLTGYCAKAISIVSNAE